MVYWLIFVLMVTWIPASGCDRQTAPLSSDFAHEELPPIQRAESNREPVLPSRCLFRPRFQTADDTIQAGTAFPVVLPGIEQPVLLTALHLLGPSGGLDRDIEPNEIGESLEGLMIVDLFDETPGIDLPVNPVYMPETAPLGTRSRDGDVVAFRLPTGLEIGPLALADSLPQPNERVWLAAQLVSGAPPDQKLHSGVFHGVDEDGDFIIEFDNPDLDKRATSGAPVLNAAGRVVAVNLGGWREGSRVFGIANPVTRFRDALLSSVRGRPQ